MQYRQNGTEVEITGIREFDPIKIFECGQCFRWNREADGSYIGVAMGKAARVRRDGGGIFISGTVEDFLTIWRAYFDLDRDYGAIVRRLSIDAFMAAAAEHGAGIRILRQDAWEALCSFILSQCNNIPRIKQIVGKFCATFGAPVFFEGRTYYAFPSAEKTAALTLEDLAPIRCGFRASALLEAARAVASGELDLAALRRKSRKMPWQRLKGSAGAATRAPAASCCSVFTCWTRFRWTPGSAGF
jgi:N-glycosylase/DNA lyase